MREQRLGHLFLNLSAILNLPSEGHDTAETNSIRGYLILIEGEEEIFEYAEKLGNFFKREYNYRRFFGLDYVVNEDTNE
jgi:hypothetical protein